MARIEVLVHKKFTIQSKMSYFMDKDILEHRRKSLDLHAYIFDFYSLFPQEGVILISKHISIVEIPEKHNVNGMELQFRAA